MKKTIRSNNLQILIFSAVFIVLLVGIWLIKNLVSSSTIAVIDSTPSSCTSNINTFVSTGSCGNGLAERVDYTCVEAGKKGYEGGNGNCIDPIVAFAHAQQFCGQTCTTSNVSPTPVASCVPYPCREGMMCTLIALPEGQVYCSKPTPTPSTTPTPTPTPICGPCAVKSPLPPDYCKGGQIVSLGSDQCGCSKGSSCVMPTATPISTSRPTPTSTATTTTTSTPTPTPSPKIVEVKPQPMPVMRCFKFFGRSYCINSRAWR